MSTKTGIKVTVSLANLEELKKLEAYLSKREYNYTIRGTRSENNGGGGKAAEVIEAEEEYKKLTKKDRFRLLKTEKAQIEAGETTRLALINKRISDIKASQKPKKVTKKAE